MARQREDEFRQRLIAATLLADPELKLVSALMGDDEKPSRIEEMEDGSVMLFPETEDEFEAMLEAYERDLGRMP